MDQKHIWRKDITGLRALAVLPVLIFHAFPQWLPGGFYGVDIFFVISGYLISGIIFRGLITDSFSFKDFYAKRIKRIFPNLIVLLTFVMAVGWFVSTANEYRAIGANVYRSAAFYVNFTLMREHGYFDGPSHENPLLHMWSLAIEEQFYIVFPFLAFLFWKLGKQSISALGAFVFFMTIASLACCLLLHEQNARFYFPLARFWELGAGICLAYLETFHRFSMRNHGQVVADGMSLLGLVLVLMALLIPTSWYAPSPGIMSLMPVTGACLLITAGAHAAVNRTLLSWGWMVFIGLISYSLYLWHWPLLTFLRVSVSAPSSSLTALALLLSFPLAWLVYRFVENPIRRLSCSLSKGTVFVLLFGLVLVYTAGKVIRLQDGVPTRQMAQALAMQSDWTHLQGLSAYHKGSDLKVSNPQEIPRIVFVGDSHIEQYHPRAMLLSDQKRVGIGFITDPSCMASVGVTFNDTVCANATAELAALLQRSELKTIVIAEKWGDYLKKRPALMESGWKAYKDLISRFLAGHPDRRVYVLLDNPWDESKNREFDVMRIVGNRFSFMKNPPSAVPVALPQDETWKKGNEFILRFRENRAVYIRTSDKICPHGICDLLNYKDDDHLRASYVREHATWIDQVFE